ncbi:MAG: hypothetical protein V7637_6512 [Mycobacteriales bacterium]
MEIRVLGLVELYGDGPQVKFGSKMERCLFAGLVMDLGRHVPREELIRRVWGDDTPDKVGTALNTLVSRLRKRLAEANGPDAARLVGRERSYALLVDPQTVDLYRFRKLAAEAAVGRTGAAAMASLRQAVELWRGEPLGGLSTDWIVNMRRSLRDEYLQAYVRLVDGELALGQHQQLVAELSEQVARNPLAEPLIARLMIAHCRCENQAAALICYEEARQRISHELGADPTPTLRALHQQILSRHPAALAAEPVTVELSAAGQPDDRPGGRAATGGQPPVAPAPHRPAAANALPASTPAMPTRHRTPPPPTTPPPATQPRAAAWRRPTRSAPVVGVLVVLLTVGVGGSAAPAVLLGPCPHPAQLSVTASPDIAPSLGAAVDQFEEQARAADGCRLADVTLSPVQSAQTRNALGEGWREVDFRVAPEPDVWVPDSIMDAWQVTAQLQARGLTAPRLTVAGPLAHSPVVLAVGREQERQLGGDGHYRWSDLVASGGRPIGRPSPTSSGVGLAATAALYRAALGGAVLDEPALAAKDALPKLRQVERRLVGDDDSGDSALCPARGPAVPPLGEFLTSEKFVVDYDTGSAPSDGCGSSEPPHPDLVSLYATDGTPFLDFPFVRVDRPGRARSLPRERLIGELYDFLTTPAAVQLFLHSGFRDVEDNVDSAILPTEKPLPQAPPAPAAMTALLAAWAQARRPANVVLAVDTSAAMATPFSHVGGTQLSAVTDALDLSLLHIGSQDRIGLWQVAGPAGPRQLVPLGPAGSATAATSRAAAVRGQLAGLRPGGPAPRLSDAVQTGVTALRRLDDAAGWDAADAIVLVIGGGGELAGGAAPALSAGGPTQVFVVGFSDPVCQSRAVAELTRTTGGTCYPIHAAVDVSRAIDRIAARLWGD